MKKIKIDEKMFNAVKTLLNGGATYDEVNSYMGVSLASIGRISTAETYADYKQMIAASAIALKKKREAQKAVEAPTEKPAEPATEAPVKEVKTSVTIQATHYMMQEMQETNRLLKDISNKLAFIVEQLA